MITLAYQYRFFPDNDQKAQLANEFGCARFVWNWALDQKKSCWKNGKLNVSYEEISKEFTQLRNATGFEFLKIPARTTSTNKLRDLDQAFSNFYNSRTRKRKGELIGKPKFKNIDSKKSIRYRDVFLKNKQLKIPKLGKYINIKWHRDLPVDARILSATISQNLIGGYYISICFESNISNILEVNSNQIGLDLGIKNYVVDSNGDKRNLPSKLKQLDKKLKKLSSKFSKAKNGSKRQKKLKHRKRRCQNKINNIKKNFIHELTTEIVKLNQLICIETLKIKQMQKNRSYAPKIQVQSWGEFYRCLKYKAVKFGRVVVEVDQYYASSKICNSCGYKNTELIGTKDRSWICPVCETNHDRDINAAINIRNEGIKIL
jgi:putative transposase